MTDDVACAGCLRRAWLVAALAGRVARARERRRHLPELLALADRELIAALAADRAPGVTAAYERFDEGRARRACAAAGLRARCRHDRRYPPALGAARDAPAVLHVAGDLERWPGLRDGPAVAIVGARRASPYGLEMARTLARGLARAGVTVVSGMALGIDSAAHAGALEGDGLTVAVLAGGADRAYPASKRALYRRIAERGMIVSEMPPGFVAHPWCFPARNRTIAGLAQLTVVVEATTGSGSLITAGIARDLGRDVAAVPGRVTSELAAGANALLFDGAALIRGAQDVLDLLFGAGARIAPPEVAPGALDPALRRLLAAVGDGRDTVGALATRAGDVSPVMTGLAQLELLGLVRRGVGGRYARVA